jgi:hypothetical protein
VPDAAGVDGDSDDAGDSVGDAGSDACPEPVSEGCGSSVAVLVSSETGVGSSLHPARARLLATTTAATPAQRRTARARTGREVVGKVMLATVEARRRLPAPRRAARA